MSPRTISNVTYDFSGRVVLVTGGSHGIGRAHALGFAAAGADLVICDIAGPIASVPYDLGDTDALNQTADDVRALGSRCLPLICDVRDNRQVEVMVGEGVAEFGKIDVLISNAGVDSFPSVLEMTEEQWDNVIDTNLKGTFHCCKHAATHMVQRRSGKIITTGSTAAIVGAPGQAHYAASKHGVIGFSRSLAIELAEYGINVNVVCPGAHATPMVSGIQASPHAEWLKGMPELVGSFNLFDSHALLEPEEITRAMMWLASDAADFVTGAVVMVDAGFTIK